MRALIPLDVWAAAALAIVTVLAAILGPSQAAFIAIYVAMCLYVVFETFGSEMRDPP